MRLRVHKFGIHSFFYKFAYYKIGADSHKPVLSPVLEILYTNITILCHGFFYYLDATRA
jgi:hypothetical protein